MSDDFRLPTGGLIDRDTKLHFTFNGVPMVGHPGDTLASALLANGVHHVATSIKYGRPRGVMAAGVDEPNALVRVDSPLSEPMLTATTVELYDGLVAHGLSGRGRLVDQPDSARYDAKHVHCDVLVVGAGPAGLIAALSAARAGARVILVDDQSQAGGSLLGSDEYLDMWPALTWA
ncbi:MAG: 2Fe-2S iron-sulfur cluster-binding protein, partial [Actinomycetota bacterium]|nr:2Fe-2S iron-sulfur cluster-binding protein [Actinomycetota bacterium]